MNKAIFLDRDGVICKLLENDPVPHHPLNLITRWDQFEFIPGALEAFLMLAAEDYRLLVISNQSGIGRGYATKEAVTDVFDMMCEMVMRRTHCCLGYAFCPHVPEDHCCCHKPQPGMIYQLAIKHDIGLSRSWLVGDSLCDMGAAANAGIPITHRVLIPSEHTEKSAVMLAGHEAVNLLAAVEIITECKVLAD